MEHSSETADALCRAFCRAFHYEGLTFTLEGTDGSAAAVQSFDGAPVVNCSVTFSISGGSVVSVSGTHLPQEGQASGSGNALSALAALNEVLSTIRSGAVVTAVTDLYLCYELQSTTATPMALVPCLVCGHRYRLLLCKLFYRRGLHRLSRQAEIFFGFSLPSVRMPFSASWTGGRFFRNFDEFCHQTGRSCRKGLHFIRGYGIVCVCELFRAEISAAFPGLLLV